MTIAAAGPSHHLIFSELTIPFLEDYAECIEIPFDLNKVLVANARPLCLERGLELLPELSELFLIHTNSLVRCTVSAPLCKDLWRLGREALTETQA
jgi:hypothetical protein